MTTKLRQQWFIVTTRTTDDFERVHLLTGEELSELADVHVNIGKLSWVALRGPSVFLGLRVISPCKQLLCSQVEARHYTNLLEMSFCQIATALYA